VLRHGLEHLVKMSAYLMHVCTDACAGRVLDACSDTVPDACKQSTVFDGSTGGVPDTCTGGVLDAYLIFEQAECLCLYRRSN
jgi:hypothetical protein